jgi:uncharacterized membrane protein
MTNPNHKSKKLVHSQGKTEITSFEGLIPDNDSLDKLEQYAPGATKKWMELAESEIKSRQYNEKHFLTTVRWSNWLGIFIAFVVSILIAGVGAYTIHLGYPQYGCAIICGAMAQSIAAFIFKNKNSNQ